VNSQASNCISEYRKETENGWKRILKHKKEE
jgi:hypothetical protein